jgi:hypothetical protein
VHFGLGRHRRVREQLQRRRDHLRRRRGHCQWPPTLIGSEALW